MNSIARLLLLLFIAITAIKTNAQTYNYNNGVNTPTSSSDREAAERNRKNTLNSLKSNEYNSSPREKSTGTNNNSNRNTNYDPKYYPNLEADGLIPFYNPYSGKYGFVNKFNVIIIKDNFEEKAVFKNGFAKVSIAEKLFGLRDQKVIKYYLIDTKGKIVKEVRSDKFISDSIAKVKQNEYNAKELARYNKENEVKRKNALDNLFIKTNVRYETESNYGNYIIVSKDKKYGVLDTAGKIIIPLKYDDLGRFIEGFSIAAMNKKYGIIDKSGTVVFPLKYDIIYIGGPDGSARVLLDKKWGYVDNNGNEVIPLKYEEIYYSSDLNIYQAKLNNKWGVINKAVEELIPFVYNELKVDYSNKLIIVKKDDKWGIIDKKGQVLIPFKYDKIDPFYQGLAAVSIYGKWGVINTSREIAKPIYDDVYLFRENYRTKKNDLHKLVIGENTYHLVNLENDKYAVREVINNLKTSTGNVIFPPSGIAPVWLENDKKYVFINEDREYVIPRQFDYAFNFSNGFARVKVAGKWGFVDEKGNDVISFIYEDARDYSSGLAPVKMGGKWGYIDEKGKVTIQFEYKEANVFFDGLAAVKLDDKWGFIDIDGKVVIPFKFSYTEAFKDGKAKVSKSDNYRNNFFIDKSGKKVND